jgi:type IV pilus assembly protein PilV
MKQIRPTPHCRGFSLVEVMVALLVISIGLLGIAKMQALSLSNTASARLRALGALEAASLAATMRADRTYWAAAAVAGTDLVVKIQGATITSTTDPNLSGTTACANGTVCTPTQMAAYDLANWAGYVNNVIQNEAATIDCTLPAPVAPLVTSPVTCSITIAWAENLVSANSAQTSTNGASLTTPQYTLVIEP